MRPDRRTYIGVCAALLASACQRAGTSVADDPVLGNEPPAPAATRSQFNVPLDYDFTPIMATVERAVPRTFGSLNTVRQMGDDQRRHYAFEATRGPFTAFVTGSRVHLRATLSYAARGFYKPVVGPTIHAGCGSTDDRPRIIVELVTPLTVDSTWHLRSAARLARVEPATPMDRCKVSVLRVDVTDRVIEAARHALTAQLPGIDKKVNAISLTGHATGWWATLNRPIRLRDGVWLLLQPERLRVGDIKGAGHILTIQAGVDAYPRIVTGTAEPAGTASPLPPLGGAPGSHGFNLVIDGNIDYATVSKALTAVLRGKSVTVKGQTVAVQSVAAAGRTGGRLALAVSFSGDANGTLTLVGAPRYDAAQAQIVVPDLDYDLATNNSVVDVIAWVKSDALRSMLREKARVSVAPVLDRGKALLTAGLNRTIGTSLTLAATVDSVAVLGLYVRRPGIVVRAGAMGTAQVSVRQKTP